MIQAADTNPIPSAAAPDATQATPAAGLLSPTGGAASSISLSPRQYDAWEALCRNDVAEVLYGGAKGGGKSVLLCLWAYAWACELIRQFDIQPQKHPIPVGWIGRARSVDFCDTTLETWKRVIPASAYELRIADREIIIAGRVKIEFGGLDSEESVHKFNSAEYCFVGVDQAEETTRDSIAVLRGSLRRNINGRHVRTKCLWTANPAACWLRDEFVRGQEAGKVFVPALPQDNPHLPGGYVDRLKDAFRHRPELLAAYIDGSWDMVSGSNQLIKDLWLAQSAKRTLYPSPSYTLIACDVARFGDDETVIDVLKDTQPIASEVYGQRDTMHTANRLYVLSRKHGNCLIVIDGVGVGAGVADRVVELGGEVLVINSAESAGEKDRYYNLRAEMWDLAATMFSDGDVSLQTDDEVLKQQLLTPTYEYRNGRLLVEPKDKIKARSNGRSPDRADTYIMGLYGLCYLRRRLRQSAESTTLKKPTEPARTIQDGSYAARREMYERRRQLQEAW